MNDHDQRPQPGKNRHHHRRLRLRPRRMKTKTTTMKALPGKAATVHGRGDDERGGRGMSTHPTYKTP